MKELIIDEEADYCRSERSKKYVARMALKYFTVGNGATII